MAENGATPSDGLIDAATKEKAATTLSLLPRYSQLHTGIDIDSSCLAIALQMHGGFVIQ